jgi:protein SCO1/2
MFNKKIVRAQWLILGVITCVLLNNNVQATESHDHHQHHDPHAKHKQMGTAGMEEQSQGGAELDIPETALLNQYGQSVNFRQDVVADNIVVMDFIYTSCTTVCPVLSAVMAQVQRKLEPRIGHGVSLVSLTVDPVRDNPQRLLDYSRQHDAGPGWTWLTGSKPAVDSVLVSLGTYTPNFVDHPSLVMVGDVKTGQWTRFYGFPSPDRIVATVNKLLKERAKLDSKEAVEGAFLWN